MTNRGNPLCHIQRIDKDENNTHCWQVLIERNGQLYRRFFTDNVYGGKDRSLQEAIAHRDACLEKFEDSIPDYIVALRNQKRRNNKSGIVGVHRAIIYTRAGTPSPYWIAAWHDINGKTRLRRFSVNRHGEEGAKHLACRAREDAMEDLKKILAVRKEEGAFRIVEISQSQSYSKVQAEEPQLGS